VTSIEIDPELTRRAGDALTAAGYVARVITGDGRAGDAGAAPFDRIIVTASADAIPNAWLDQLQSGGRLVLPLRFDHGALPQAIAVYELDGDTLRSVEMTWGGFMPLHGGDGGNDGPPGDAVNASVSVKGRHELLTQAGGPGLARLSLKARRRLLASLLAGPVARDRAGAVTVRWPAPPDLLVFLALRIQRDRLLVINEPGTCGVGVSDSEARAATMAVFPTDRLRRGDRPSEPILRPQRRRWRLERYGSAGPSPELTELLEEWRRLVRSNRSRFQITARRSTGANAELAFRWTT
jgi:hypothetical protein